MKHFVATVLFLIGISHADSAHPWGIEGHSVVGDLAVVRLNEGAREELAEILGGLNPEVIAHACYWPDTMRPDRLWASAAPLHYVNIPRGQDTYDRARDCPDGRCVTETIKYFAALLRDQSQLKENRAVAFGWLCHLVADLHNPMHTGYEDDSGGNDVTVTYLNKPVNLHEFWDGTVIRLQSANREALTTYLVRTLPATQRGWNPAMVDAWTNESRALLLEAGYPASSRISPEFEARSWQIIQTQLQAAGVRLAQIVNEELSD